MCSSLNVYYERVGSKRNYLGKVYTQGEGLSSAKCNYLYELNTLFLSLHFPFMISLLYNEACWTTSAPTGPPVGFFQVTLKFFTKIFNTLLSPFLFSFLRKKERNKGEGEKSFLILFIGEFYDNRRRTKRA